MRILLVGEYSNLHNSLKTGLQRLGHEVTLISTGDAFKKFPSDVLLKAGRIEGFAPLNWYRKALFRFTGFDIATMEIGYRAMDFLFDQKPYDVIQLINEYPLKTPYFLERRFIERLHALTKKLVILACGDDYIYLNNLDKLPHHPALQHSEIQFPYSEKYLTPAHKKYHEFVFAKKDAIISTDLDYHPAYEGKADYMGMIPNPVCVEKLKFQPPTDLKPIIIFHGINQTNYYKKGNDFFEAALEQIQEKYGNRIEVRTARNLPYTEYLKTYEDAHILLDQAYALDQGYNALEAMAWGKVVFTGAGEAFCKNYNLKKNEVAIHTVPDVGKIVRHLEALIENPKRILEIGQNARTFIEKHHDATEVAGQYLKAWEQIKARAET